MTASGSAGFPSPGWPSSGGWPPPPPPWPETPSPPGFPPTVPLAPPPPPRKKSPLLGVIGGLAFVAAVAFFGFALANYLNASTPPTPPTAPSAPPVPAPTPTGVASTAAPSPAPTPEPSYHQVTDVPEPDLNPPDIPVPKDAAHAKTWSKQNKLYQQSVPVPTACTVRFVDMQKVSAKAYQAYLNEVAGCLWGVWHDPVTAAGYQLPRPPVTVYTKPVQSPCGRLDTQNAYYCSGNQRIYYANDFYTAFSDDLRGQRFLAEMILAHEFGHDIQGRTGIFYATIMLEQVSTEKKALEFNRRLELQADCFAGHWLGAVASATSLTEQDRTNLAAAAEQIGLPQPDVYDDHGSSQSRRNWLLTGLDNALIGRCNTFAASSVKVR
ncbi:MAG: neutral zinc metallopeptidase [Propionibacteriales bacterium]|nr:neutral zinc metallopeptidase [Propionibacteriales bacterium]